jgi:hypothetical protein
MKKKAIIIKQEGYASESQTRTGKQRSQSHMKPQTAPAEPERRRSQTFIPRRK